MQPHIVKMNFCSDCDFEAVSEANLKEHVNNEHFFNSVFSFIYHDNADIKEECEDDEEDNSEDVPSSITSELKEKDKKAYKCEDCKFSTSTKQSLKSHTEGRHLKTVRYNCSDCDFKAYQTSHVKYHINSKHNNEATVQMIGCTSCEQNLKHSHIKGRKAKASNKDDNAGKFEKKTSKALLCENCDFSTNTK